MAESPPPPDSTSELDPLYRHAMREARFILTLWTCCFFYTVIYCYLYGYLTHEPLPESSSTGPAIGKIVGPLESFNRAADSVSYPLNLGIPDWVFYGVALPWVVCIVASTWFCLFVFVEDDLAAGSEDPKEVAA